MHVQPTSRLLPRVGAGAALLLAAASAQAIKPSDIAIPTPPPMHSSAGSSQVFTVADPKLRADVLSAIETAEGASGGSSSLTLQTARSMGREGPTYVERWMLTSHTYSVAYRVKMTPSPKGGVDFSVEKIPS